MKTLLSVGLVAALLLSLACSKSTHFTAPLTVNQYAAWACGFWDNEPTWGEARMGLDRILQEHLDEGRDITPPLALREYHRIMGQVFEVMLQFVRDTDPDAIANDSDLERDPAFLALGPALAKAIQKLPAEIREVMNEYGCDLGD